jgi:hypothetical protein
MSPTRTGDALMPQEITGGPMPQFSVNLLVRNVENSGKFYRDVIGATVGYADGTSPRWS